MSTTADGRSSDSTIAAFDLGSNTIKMTVARRRKSSRKIGLDEFLWRSATVRLGAGIEATGRLADDRIAAALEALTGFANEAREAGATRLIGVATEATRVASNGEEFLARVREQTGLELAVITGDREAELTFRGLQESYDLTGDVVVADIGGGSTELIVALGGEFRSGRSVALGSGRLTDRLVHSDPPTPEQIQACRSATANALSGVELPSTKFARLIAVGGTGEYMMRLLGDHPVSTLIAIDEVLDRLTRIPSGVLATTLAIPEARARVLPAGIAIVREIAERLQPASIEGAKSGIRTGLLLAAFAGEL